MLVKINKIDDNNKNWKGMCPPDKWNLELRKMFSKLKRGRVLKHNCNSTYWV